MPLTRHYILANTSMSYKGHLKCNEIVILQKDPKKSRVVFSLFSHYRRMMPENTQCYFKYFCNDRDHNENTRIKHRNTVLFVVFLTLFRKDG